MLRQWLDKMPNEFGRLSLIFHFIEWYGSDLFADIAAPLPPSSAGHRGTGAPIPDRICLFARQGVLPKGAWQFGDGRARHSGSAGFVLSRELNASRCATYIGATPHCEQPSEEARYRQRCVSWKCTTGCDQSRSEKASMWNGPSTLRFTMAGLQRRQSWNGRAAATVRDAIRQEADSRREVEAG